MEEYSLRKKESFCAPGDPYRYGHLKISKIFSDAFRGPKLKKPVGQWLILLQKLKLYLPKFYNIS